MTAIINAEVKVEPRKISFSPTPPEQSREFPLLPLHLRGKVVSTGGETYEVSAEKWGIGRGRALKNFMGLHGVPINPGDEFEMPWNYLHDLIVNRQAIWLIDESDKADLEFVEKAKQAGLKVEPPARKVADRPEFQRLQRNLKDTMR